MPIIQRAFSSNPVAVCFSANEGFADYLCVMLQSIIDKSSRHNRYDIVLLASSMTNEKSNNLHSLFVGRPNFSFRIVDSSEILSQYDLFTGDAKNTGRLSLDTYTRLAIPELFQDYKRVLYLDGDMVANVDIADFYELSFDGNKIISSRDLWGTCNCYMDGDSLRDYREHVVGMDNVDDYFIGGMIMFNMDLIDPETSERLFELASERNWKHHDQDVMNRFFQHETKLVDASWDYLSDKYDTIRYLPSYLQEEFKIAQKSPKIVHYGGARKPWKFSHQENDMLFWEAAWKTPVFWSVLNQRPWALEYKSYVLDRLGAEPPTKTFKNHDVKFQINNKAVGSFSSRNVYLEFCELQGSHFVLEGYVPLFGLDGSESVQMFVRCGNSVFYPVASKHDNFRYLNQNKKRFKTKPFKFIIDSAEIEPGTILGFVCQIDGVPIPLKKMQYSKHCAVSPRYVNSYQFSSGFILRPAPKGFVVEPCSQEDKEKQEERLLKELSLDENFEQICRLRKAAINYNPIGKKKIWLFSDRTNKADDNGEAMFEYITENHSDEIESYFILRQDSLDYSRLSKIGNVVPYLSEQHKLLHLICDCNLSSQADQPVFLPFDNIQAFCGLLRHQKYIFLQHGVIKNDISRWFNRLNIDPYLFVTSSKRELDSIVNTPRYSFDESIVKLTGLPRHDRLYSDDKKMITFMPTWRINLCERNKEDEGVWHTKPNFRNSDYCKFFNCILNSSKLKAATEELGYTLAFMPHPNIAQSIDDFDLPSYVKTLGTETSYREVFAHSSVVVTDYSSSVMDFAYLRKPIIYTHFDYEDFFSGVHIASVGYFDDKVDGFGPVTDTVDALIEQIIKTLQSNCKMDKVFKDRVDSFFAFNDKGNCERVFTEIRNKTVLDNALPETSKAADVEIVFDNPPKPFEQTLRKFTKVSRTKLSNCVSELNIPKHNTSWKRSLTNTLPVFVSENDHEPLIVPYRDFISNKWAPLNLPRLASIDKKAQFVAYCAMKIARSVPYNGNDWSKPLEDKYLGIGWRPVHNIDVNGFCRGDVISFKNGTYALVLEEKADKYTFVYSRLFRSYHRIVRGGLGLTQSKRTLDELPEINWVLRRIY